MYLEVLDKFIDIYSNISYLTAVVTAGTATRAAGSAQSVAGGIDRRHRYLWHCRPAVRCAAGSRFTLGLACRLFFCGFRNFSIVSSVECRAYLLAVVAEAGF